MKRFYREVALAAAAEGWQVRLDQKPVRTPKGTPLTLPTLALAQGVAAEWRSVAERVDPRTMPLTRLAATVLDQLPARRRDAIEEALEVGRWDLLCYRAQHPEALVDRQRQAWQPWLDWAEARYGVRLQPVHGIQPIDQPRSALLRLRHALDELDDWRLVGVHGAARETGSLILALALLETRIDGAQAFQLAYLEELWELEQWGEDAEQRRRHRHIAGELAALARYLRALAP